MTVKQDYVSGDTVSVAWLNAVATVSNTAATVDGTETLTGKTLTTPRVDYVKDTNGAPILNFHGAAGAVNYINLSNNIATGRPGFAADGSDTNIGIAFVPKGIGDIQVYQPTGGVTIAASGNDAAVDCNITTKGAGLVRANGVEVATVTTIRNNNGTVLAAAAGVFNP